MSCPPVFLISSPRSGSNWTKAALNAHPAVVCTEQRLYGGFLEAWIDDPVTQRSHPRFTLDRMVEIMSAHNNYPCPLSREDLAQAMTGTLARALVDLARRTSGRPVVVDKVTPYVDTAAVVVAGIRRDFPDARIVLLERDGRDVLTSGVFNWLKRRRPGAEWNAHRQARYARLAEGRADVALERLFSDEDIAYWGRHWLDPFEAVLPAADYVLRYERLHADQAGELARLFAFLGLESGPGVVRACVEASTFERLSGGRKRGEMDPADPTGLIRKGIVGDWRHWFTRADGAAFHDLAGRWLLDRGFEADPDWFIRLPERIAG